MEQDSRSLCAEAPAAGYDFHDPAFVTWWLNSLYLLPEEDQVAVAERLRQAVHAPEAREEILAFIEVRSCTLQETREGNAHIPSGPPDAAMPSDWRRALRSAWMARPWLTGLGLLGAVFVAGKGLWFLGRLLAQAAS